MVEGQGFIYTSKDIDQVEREINDDKKITERLNKLKYLFL